MNFSRSDVYFFDNNKDKHLSMGDIFLWHACSNILHIFYVILLKDLLGNHYKFWI